MAAFAVRIGVAVLFLALGLALVFGLDRMGLRAEALGLPLVLRVPAGLWHLAAGVLLLWPGRIVQGAAMGLVACAAALLAHLTVLGLDSAPPALALGAVLAAILWRRRKDLAAELRKT